MALTITPIEYLKISGCESTSDGGTWTGNAIAGGIGEMQREGTYCVGATLRTLGTNDMTLTKASGTWDLSGVKHLRIWFMYTNRSNLKLLSEGGVQLFVGDASNTAYWYVAGRLTYPGGWYPLVVDLSATPSIGSKPTNMLCTKIGLRIDLHTAVTKNVQNCWIDHLCHCDGLQCSGTPQYGFYDIESQDAATTGAWGIIRKIGGIYYLLGSLDITTDFKSLSQIGVFENRWVNSALYEIRTTTASGKFQLGDKAGSAGISGCTVRTEELTQTPKFKITCTDTNVTDFKLYGSTFLDSGVISLPLTGTNREVLNCNFEKCSNILPQTISIKYSNFISYGNLSLSTSNIENCNFISGTGLLTAGGGLIKNCAIISPSVAVAMLWDINVNTNTKLDGTSFTSTGTGHAIELEDNCPAEITLTNVNFYSYAEVDGDTGNEAIFNDSGKFIKINISGGSTPSVKNGTGASTQVVSGQKTFSFTVKNEVGTSLTGYEWHIYENDPTPGKLGDEIVGQENATQASQSYNYSWTEDIDIVIQVMHNDYEEAIVYDVLGNMNKSITITLKEEVNI